MKYEQYIEDELIKGLMKPVFEKFEIELSKALNKTIESLLSDEKIKERIVQDISYRISNDICQLNKDYQNDKYYINNIQSAIVNKVAEQVTETELKNIIIAGLIKR